MHVCYVNERVVVCRDDEGEGGEGGPVVQRVRGEEEVGTGEVPTEHNHIII